MGLRVTTKEASKITGISEYSLTCMRKQGVISYLKIGYGRGRILFDIDVLDAELKKWKKKTRKSKRSYLNNTSRISTQSLILRVAY